MESVPTSRNFLIFRNDLQVRHPNATLTAAIILLIIGNSSLKTNVISNHMNLAQLAENFLPTLPDIDEGA